MGHAPAVVNTRFDTRPVVIHAAGSHGLKPYWPPIRDALFAAPSRSLGAVPGMRIFTCNNGHEAMGMLERGLDHLGVPYDVAGRGIDPWVNSEAKPRAILDYLATLDDDELVLYADSRDALIIDDPRIARDRFLQEFSCQLLFSPGRFSYPPAPELEQFERQVAPDPAIAEVHLQGGMWIGRVPFCREFFAAVAEADPIAQAPESEQGLLRQAFPRFHPDAQLDYECRIFQNVGFLYAAVLEVRDAAGNTVEVAGLP